MNFSGRGPQTGDRVLEPVLRIARFVKLVSLGPEFTVDVAKAIAQRSLSPDTLRQRRIVLVVSAVTLLIGVGGLIPKKFTVIGVELSHADQGRLLLAAKALILVLLIEFLVSASADAYARWLEIRRAELARPSGRSAGVAAMGADSVEEIMATALERRRRIEAQDVLSRPLIALAVAITVVDWVPTVVLPLYVVVTV